MLINANKSLYQFEEKLKSGGFPIITPELGNDLVEFISQKSILPPQEILSLPVFLQHAPLVTNYWNNFKAIYKLLETRLLRLSKSLKTTKSSISERDFLIENLGIIIHRLEHIDECIACKDLAFKGKYWLRDCKNQCEQWPGGIRYSKRFLEYKNQSTGDLNLIDKVILENKLKRIDDVLEADIFIENFQGMKLLSLLLLTRSNKHSEDLQTFLLQSKFSDFNLLDTENYGLPKFDTVKTYRFWDRNNPWKKRRSSIIQNDTNGNIKYRERYPVISDFITKPKPLIKTLHYMRRRSRRLLRELQENNQDLYVQLSMNYLEKLTSPRKKNLSELWLLNEIVFEKTPDISHARHGRGNIRYLNNFLTKDHHTFSCQDAWQGTLDRIKPLLCNNSQYLCVAEFFAKIWSHSSNPYKDERLPLPIKTYESYLQSSSSYLVDFAFKQLFKNLRLIKLIHPAAIARGLAVLDAQVAKKYFKQIFEAFRADESENWITRFTYELDDAIYSLLQSNNQSTDLDRAMNLGLLSLRFSWPGELRCSMSERNLLSFNTPFQWSNKTPLSIWSKSIWKTPNTSKSHLGFLGWHHAIFDKFLLQSAINMSQIDISNYLKKAHPERLLNLLTFQVPLLRCHGSKLKLSDAKEYNLTPDLKKEIQSLKLNNSQSALNEYDPIELKNGFLSRLGQRELSAQDGHFTPSDLRHEHCELCRSNVKNHMFFEPFIFQNNDNAYKYRMENGWVKDSIARQRKKWDKIRSRSFWTKIHNFNEHYLKVDCPEWFFELVLLELNQRNKNNNLDHSLLSRVRKLTTNVVKRGNTAFLVKLLENKIFISENIALDNLINCVDSEWQETLKGGANLPINKVTSEPWLRELWEKLGSNETSLKTIVQDRFINNPVFSDTIIKNFLPDFNSIKSDEQTDYVIKLLEHNQDHFLTNVSDHLKLCLSSDQVLSEKAIKLKVQHGMDAVFALNLLESNSPLGERYAMQYFNSVEPDDADFEDNLMMICDSPNKHSREFGLELLNKHHLALHMPKMLLMLKENRHKNIKLFVASYLANNNNRFINTSDFDIGILRTRNTERYTKELVKKRISAEIKNKNKTPDMLFKALKELSYGLIQSDKEWALKCLTLLSRDNHQIPEIIIKDLEETNHESCASISTK